MEEWRASDGRYHNSLDLAGLFTFTIVNDGTDYWMVDQNDKLSRQAGQHLKDLKRSWRRVCDTASLESVRIHDLRHTFASVGAMGGLSLLMIGRLLGHTRPETTARYSHLADDPVRLANETIARRIGSRILAKPMVSYGNLSGASLRRK